MLNRKSKRLLTLGRVVDFEEGIFDLSQICDLPSRPCPGPRGWAGRS